MKIFGFVKKVFLIGLAILSGFTNENSLNAIPLSCISMSNQENLGLMFIIISDIGIKINADVNTKK